MLEWILQYKEMLKDGPEGAMKDDHGTKPTDKGSVNEPNWLLRRVDI